VKKAVETLASLGYLIIKEGDISGKILTVQFSMLHVSMGAGEISGFNIIVFFAGK